MREGRTKPRGWARYALVTRVAVQGESMAPLLRPGDRLLVVRTRRPRLGDVVAAADPREPGRVLVKRIAGIYGDQVELRGDNPAASTDSRTFGALPRDALRGRAVYRYAPSDRVGRL